MRSPYRRPHGHGGAVEGRRRGGVLCPPPLLAPAPLLLLPPSFRFPRSHRSFPKRGTPMAAFNVNAPGNVWSNNAWDDGSIVVGQM